MASLILSSDERSSPGGHSTVRLHKAWVTSPMDAIIACLVQDAGCYSKAAMNVAEWILAGQEMIGAW